VADEWGGFAPAAARARIAPAPEPRPRAGRGKETRVYVVCVSIHVKAAHLEAFIAATLANARASRGEPGNLRYDVLRQEQDAARFTLVEAYRSAEDFAAHQKTAHYLKWRETVAVGIKHWSLDPPPASE
jgi:autoinducer 2-degrading protein